ncbi:hypothetical protein T10_4062 [Trichinella papuae]|uniref:Uncharacterized protein n=1 Tax=Trichinella papuae TaxID=268474 RepID=A0A0V1MKB9_9BILA|nr:hypothetical protein T10_4062 [Trichinella papuae]
MHGNKPWPKEEEEEEEELEEEEEEAEEQERIEARLLPITCEIFKCIDRRLDDQVLLYSKIPAIIEFGIEFSKLANQNRLLVLLPKIVHFSRSVIDGTLPGEPAVVLYPLRLISIDISKSLTDRLGLVEDVPNCI